jgi:5-methylcytosine-specific restriction endonuclease McrA
MTIEQIKPTRRGTTNGNARGGSDERRRRREWLVQTYRADRDVVTIALFHGPIVVEVISGTEGSQPACRCYRCGQLLTADTLTVDRIKPGCHGGTYARSNIRPACGRCNSSTGATTRRKR